MRGFFANIGAAAISRYAGALLLFGCALLLAEATDAGQLSPYEKPDAEAPAFSLEALDGTTHRLEDYRGTVVLVNFWATWCPPCLAEMPSMQRLADTMTGEGFAILAINVGEGPFRVSKFIRLIGARFAVLLDKEGVTFRAWGGDVYPTSFVLDEAGQIRYVAYGPLEWDSDDAVTKINGLLRGRQTAAE